MKSLIVEARVGRFGAYVLIRYGKNAIFARDLDEVEQLARALLEHAQAAAQPAKPAAEAAKPAAQPAKPAAEAAKPAAQPAKPAAEAAKPAAQPAKPAAEAAKPAAQPAKPAAEAAKPAAQPMTATAVIGAIAAEAGVDPASVRQALARSRRFAGLRKWHEQKHGGTLTSCLACLIAVKRKGYRSIMR